MRRKMASEYLRDVHGVVLSHATLAKLAVTGGGPRFYLDGRFPLYPQPELDSFAVERLGPMRSSTSEAFVGHRGDGGILRHEMACSSSPAGLILPRDRSRNA